MNFINKYGIQPCDFLGHRVINLLLIFRDTEIKWTRKTAQRVQQEILKLHDEPNIPPVAANELILQVWTYRFCQNNNSNK